MSNNIIKLKEDVADFKEYLDKTDPRSLTQEDFSSMNAMFTSIEEDIMEMESEYAMLILYLKDFKECIRNFRKMYFESHQDT